MSDQVWWPKQREGLAAFLDDAELARLAAVTESAQVASGALVLHRDAASRSLLLIESGELEVVEEHLGDLRVLAVMGPGDVAGELGFVDGWPRSHDVRARTACILRRITREKLMSLAASEPAVFGKVAVGLAVILAARFREIAAELAPVRAFAASLQEPMEAPLDSEPAEGFAALDEGAAPPGDPGSAVAVLQRIANKTTRGTAGL